VVGGILAVVVLAGAGGVYAYDRGGRERIAAGVSVEGVDVGGLEVGAARAKLRAALVEPLDRPVRVRHGERRFRLTPRQARLVVEVDASVARALARSRQGTFLSRAVRDLTDARLDEAVDVRVRYSERAVDRLVRRVRVALGRPARDARLDLSHGRVDRSSSARGRRLLDARLKRDVTRALLSRGRRPVVVARTAVVEPKVTDAELEDRYPAVLIVDRASFRLTLYERLKRRRTYRIAVGEAGRETPAGLYAIQNKAVDPAWFVPNSDWAGDLAGKVIPADDPRNPIEARWMGIYDGAGIHGTEAVDSLGTAASRGCIRMDIPDVKALYDVVPVGAPVYIA
jgi:lipoprotein-anchoring transpeptidase ErfK/SrfK